MAPEALAPPRSPAPAAGVGASQRLTVESGEASPDWDRFVAATPGGHHAQSSVWGRVKRVLGWSATRLVVREDDAVVGGVQLLVRDIGRLGRVAFAPYGPLVAPGSERQLDSLHSALLEFGRDERIRYLKVQPAAQRQDLVEALSERGWTPSSLAAAPAATVLIDVTADEDELLGRMRRNTRKSIRASARKGLTTSTAGEERLDDFWQIVLATSARQGFTPYPRRYYETMLREFAASGGSTLVVAEFEERVLSSSMIIAFGDRASAKMGGWSGERTNLAPNESIEFASMRWAKERGCSDYDVEGIDPRVAIELERTGELPPEALEGVAHFKLSFGGRVERLPSALDIAPNRLLRPAVRLVAPRADRLRHTAHRALGRSR